MTAQVGHREEAKPTRQFRGLAFRVANESMRREIVTGWNWFAASVAPPRCRFFSAEKLQRARDYIANGRNVREAAAWLKVGKTALTGMTFCAFAF